MPKQQKGVLKASDPAGGEFPDPGTEEDSYRLSSEELFRSPAIEAVLGAGPRVVVRTGCHNITAFGDN